MGYKRRARVLFVGPPELTAAAMWAARKFGADWLDPSDSQAPTSGWADLVVTLDSAARDSLPPLPASTRQTHWNAGSPTAVHRRVDGMVGGMRLLSRSSS